MTPKPESKLERAAQENLGIVPYFTNELTKYASINHEYSEIHAFMKGFRYAIQCAENLMRRTIPHDVHADGELSGMKQVVAEFKRIAGEE